MEIKTKVSNSFFARLARENDGYAIVLTLVALPFIMAVAAWVIDASRVTNLHTDLQNAADAMALAGARELDGRNDAIPRAQAAIGALSGNQANEAWFGDGGAGMSMGSKVGIASADVVVQFLAAIPAFDDTRIANGACANPDPNCVVTGASVAIRSNNAKYVQVKVSPRNIQTIFPLPGLGRDSVAVYAEAVATYTAAACDVTPIYVCNPFEGDAVSFNQHFERGDMYGRQFTMRNSGGSSPGPGNFGFLRTNGTGASVLRDALATGSPGVCYKQGGLDTEPGATVGPVESGLNTRMGIYMGAMGSNKNDPKFRPDRNKRKGQIQGSGASGENCSKYEPEANSLDAMPLPQGIASTVLPGGEISTNGDWDIDTYWDITHGTHTTPPSQDPNYQAPSVPSAVGALRTSLPPTATVTINMPSRYDVYKYEMANNMVGNAAPNGETGVSQCHSGYNLADYPGERRVIFSAVLDCVALEASGELQGAAQNLPAVAFSRMFMTRPVTTDGSDKQINLEMIDITGQGGLGTLDNFLREEAELVR